MSIVIHSYHIFDDKGHGIKADNGKVDGIDDSSNERISVIYDYELSNFTYAQRLSLTITVIILLLMAVAGNIATLFANAKRKKCRPFFRGCLISLAVSDLMTAIFSSVTYLTQFTSSYIQDWELGATMCYMIPVITTAALLVSSMNLVGIALDRYLAVMKAFNKTWIFGKTFYITCMVFIWGLSIGIASPMISFYMQVEVYVIDTTGKNLTLESTPVEMCASKKEDNTYYFVVVLSIIFVPTLLAFVWLNTVLAQKLFHRRHLTVSVEDTSKDSTDSSKTTSTSIGVISHTKVEVNDYETNAVADKTNQREIRHLRMFYVLISLVAAFIALRLPAWIFLIMRMYGDYTRPIDWILHFVFGILTLASCVLNPLLYTFLTETIHYCEFTINKIKKCSMACFCCFRFNTPTQKAIELTENKN